MVEAYKIFTFDKITVFFKHTDYHGFVHPYNFMEWMSYAREAYFQELVPDFQKLFVTDIKMVTSKAEFEQLGDARFGDLVMIKIFSENVRRMSFDVVFDFLKRKTDELIGCGRQTLTFLDTSGTKLVKIPGSLKSVVIQYERK